MLSTGYLSSSDPVQEDDSSVSAEYTQGDTRGCGNGVARTTDVKVKPEYCNRQPKNQAHEPTTCGYILTICCEEVAIVAECGCANGRPLINPECENTPEAKRPNACQSANPGYYLVNRDGVQQSELKVCTCQNGTPTSGTACPTHNTNHCESCDNGYQLRSDFSCEWKVCTCPGGTAQVGSACTSHGAHVCSGCDDTHKLVVSKCRERCKSSSQHEICGADSWLSSSNADLCSESSCTVALDRQKCCQLPACTLSDLDTHGYALEGDYQWAQLVDAKHNRAVRPGSGWQTAGMSCASTHAPKNANSPAQYRCPSGGGVALELRNCHEKCGSASLASVCTADTNEQTWYKKRNPDGVCAGQRCSHSNADDKEKCCVKKCGHSSTGTCGGGRLKRQGDDDWCALGGDKCNVAEGDGSGPDAKVCCQETCASGFAKINDVGYHDWLRLQGKENSTHGWRRYFYNPARANERCEDFKCLIPPRSWGVINVNYTLADDAPDVATCCHLGCTPVWGKDHYRGYMFEVVGSGEQCTHLMDGKNYPPTPACNGTFTHLIRTAVPDEPGVTNWIIGTAANRAPAPKVLCDSSTHTGTAEYRCTGSNGKLHFQGCRERCTLQACSGDSNSAAVNFQLKPGTNNLCQTNRCGTDAEDKATCCLQKCGVGTEAGDVCSANHDWDRNPGEASPGAATLVCASATCQHAVAADRNNCCLSRCSWPTTESEREGYTMKGSTAQSELFRSTSAKGARPLQNPTANEGWESYSNGFICASTHRQLSHTPEYRCPTAGGALQFRHCYEKCNQDVCGNINWLKADANTNSQRTCASNQCSSNSGHQDFATCCETACHWPSADTGYEMHQGKGPDWLFGSWSLGVAARPGTGWRSYEEGFRCTGTHIGLPEFQCPGEGEELKFKNCKQRCEPPTDATKERFDKVNHAGTKYSPNKWHDVLGQHPEMYPETGTGHVMQCASGFVGSQPHTHQKVRCAVPGQPATAMDGSCDHFQCQCASGVVEPDTNDCPGKNFQLCTTCDSNYKLRENVGRTASDPNPQGQSFQGRREVKCWAKCDAVNCSERDGSPTPGTYWLRDEAKHFCNARPFNKQDCLNDCCIEACKAPTGPDTQTEPYAIADPSTWKQILKHGNLYPGKQGPQVFSAVAGKYGCRAGWHLGDGYATSGVKFRCPAAGEFVQLRGCDDNCIDWLDAGDGSGGDKGDCATEGFGPAYGALKRGVPPAPDEPYRYEPNYSRDAEPGQKLDAFTCCTRGTMCGGLFLKETAGGGQAGIDKYKEELAEGGDDVGHTWCTVEHAYGNPKPPTTLLDTNFDVTKIPNKKATCCHTPTCAQGFFAPVAGPKSCPSFTEGFVQNANRPQKHCTDHYCNEEQDEVNCCTRRAVCPFDTAVTPDLLNIFTTASGATDSPAKWFTLQPSEAQAELTDLNCADHSIATDQEAFSSERILNFCTTEHCNYGTKFQDQPDVENCCQKYETKEDYFCDGFYTPRFYGSAAEAKYACDHDFESTAVCFGYQFDANIWNGRTLGAKYYSDKLEANVEATFGNYSLLLPPGKYDADSKKHFQFDASGGSGNTTDEEILSSIDTTIKCAKVSTSVTFKNGGTLVLSPTNAAAGTTTGEGDDGTTSEGGSTTNMSSATMSLAQETSAAYYTARRSSSTRARTSARTAATTSDITTYPAGLYGNYDDAKILLIATQTQYGQTKEIPGNRVWLKQNRNVEEVTTVEEVSTHVDLSHLFPTDESLLAGTKTSARMKGQSELKVRLVLSSEAVAELQATEDAKLKALKDAEEQEKVDALKAYANKVNKSAAESAGDSTASSFLTFDGREDKDDPSRTSRSNTDGRSFYEAEEQEDPEIIRGHTKNTNTSTDGRAPDHVPVVVSLSRMSLETAGNDTTDSLDQQLRRAIQTSLNKHAPDPPGGLQKTTDESDPGTTTEGEDHAATSATAAADASSTLQLQLIRKEDVADAGAGGHEKVESLSFAATSNRIDNKNSSTGGNETDPNAPRIAVTDSDVQQPDENPFELTVKLTGTGGTAMDSLQNNEKVSEIMLRFIHKHILNDLVNKSGLHGMSENSVYVEMKPGVVITTGGTASDTTTTGGANETASSDNSSTSSTVNFSSSSFAEAIAAEEQDREALSLLSSRGTADRRRNATNSTDEDENEASPSGPIFSHCVLEPIALEKLKVWNPVNAVLNTYGGLYVLLAIHVFSWLFVLRHRIKRCIYGPDQEQLEKYRRQHQKELQQAKEKEKEDEYEPLAGEGRDSLESGGGEDILSSSATFQGKSSASFGSSSATAPPSAPGGSRNFGGGGSSAFQGSSSAFQGGSAAFGSGSAAVASKARGGSTAFGSGSAAVGSKAAGGSTAFAAGSSAFGGATSAAAAGKNKAGAASSGFGPPLSGGGSQQAEAFAGMGKSANAGAFGGGSSAFAVKPGSSSAFGGKASSALQGSVAFAAGSQAAPAK
ncbi:unnamed protein product [Amoebophrya sp. A120]|nr:unnamed protein product [Amoebophrya sp. A120]|eukprot:GSA120T00024395001.1